MIISREKKEIVRVAYVGVGRRGLSMLKNVFSKFPDIEITWMVDFREERIKLGVDFLTENGRPAPKTTTDYKEMLKDPSVDAVVIMTGWNSHVELSLASMRAGKYTAVEVGCAYDVSECYELVRTYEETGSPLMMLENDCYNRYHLLALNMARAGEYGELVHCTGAYAHYLCECDLFKIPKGESEIDTVHYRQFEYLNRAAEQYPTHEFGPIAKILRINRGNRITAITSTGSKACGISSYLKNHVSPDHPLYGKTFKQPDIVTTVITCAGGETVRLTLDTTLPRPYYSDDWTIRGTRGCFIKEGNGNDLISTIFVDGMKEPVINNYDEFAEKYDHPLYKEEWSVESENGGHIDIDWLVSRAFIEAVKAGTDTPIDAYDTATWMAIGPLSEKSLAEGGVPVAFPDFTAGKWMRREPVILSKYCVDEVVCDDSIKVVPDAKG